MFVTRLLTARQHGQARHIAFDIKHSGSFSVRAMAVVGGSTAVTLSCVDPQPKFPLLTEQKALALYLQAIGEGRCDACFESYFPPSRDATWTHPMLCAPSNDIDSDRLA
jgi:hypothetical protein